METLTTRVTISTILGRYLNLKRSEIIVEPVNGRGPSNQNRTPSYSPRGRPIRYALEPWHRLVRSSKKTDVLLDGPSAREVKAGARCPIAVL